VSKSQTQDSVARVVRRDVNITSVQDEALRREAKARGIGRNEMLRRVLDEWLVQVQKRTGS